jgi:hypothetical protein
MQFGQPMVESTKSVYVGHPASRMGERRWVKAYPLDRGQTSRFGGNALRAAADKSGKIVTEWAVLRRPDGLWQVEGYFHQRHDLAQEGTYIITGSG